VALIFDLSSPRFHPVLSPISRQQLEQHLGAPLPRDPELVLVTDLDGTLLGGSLAWRRRFYAWLARERQRVLHVFCTGRDLQSVARLLATDDSHGLAAPHLVIGDVGCSVACGISLALVPPAMEPIEARWAGKSELLAQLLVDVPGLSPQPISVDRRLAFSYDPESFDSALIARIEAHGVDCLISDDRYFDVLPAGVNKGSTLLALLDWLQVDRQRVVTAGDTLNDLAMFQTGLAGVMVGNAEPALLQRLPDLPHTYLAKAQGCEGIVEGLVHFGFGDLLGNMQEDLQG
jgi:hydroxymethylpyrimidine pyrophosphatase-like HAD family hydrolase